MMSNLLIVTYFLMSKQKNIFEWFLLSCWYVDNSSVSLENIYFLMSSCIYPLGLSQEDLNKLQKHNLSYNINDNKVDKTAKRKLPFLPCVIARIRKQDKGIKDSFVTNMIFIIALHL